MKTWFTVRDNIYGEILDFSNYVDALQEAERRVARHREGYNIRHNHVDGCDAVLIENGYDIIICIRPEVTECKK